MLKTALWTICLSGCAALPPAPEVWLCQFNGKPRAFYCTNTKTKARLKLSADDAQMRAAQCLSADDFKAVTSYVQTVKEIAEQRCK
jgi:hypothetical protein